MRTPRLQPRRRKISTLVAFVGLGASLVRVEPAGAITASHRVPIPSDVGALQVRSDGTSRVTTRRPSSSRISIVLSTLGPDGMLGAGTDLLSSPRQPPRSVATTITRQGAIAAYERPAGPDRLRSVEVVSLTSGHHPTAPQRVSPRWGSASEPIVMAGGGAAAVLFTTHRPHRSRRLMWAYRPPHSARFLPARFLTAPRTDYHFRYVVRLGPSGEGAVLETSIFPEGTPPPFRVRRLGVDGSIGPWLPVSDEGYEDGVGTIALAPDGTIAIAFAADRRIDGHGESAVVSTSLPPGASVPTPAQHLQTFPAEDDGQTVLADFSLELAIGANGQTAIATTPDESNRIKLFTGPASALKLTGDFDAPGIDIRRMVTVTRDGGVTAVWTPVPDYRATPIMATHRPPGGRFSVPKPVAPTLYKGDYASVSPWSLSPIHQSAAVLAYTDASGERSTSHLVTLSP